MTKPGIIKWEHVTHDGMSAHQGFGSTQERITLMRSRHNEVHWVVLLDMNYMCETHYLDRAKQLGQLIADGLAVKKRRNAPMDHTVNDQLNYLAGGHIPPRGGPVTVKRKSK